MTSDSLNTILHTNFPAARNGDRAAFARLVQATQRMVASVALTVTRDVAASEDVAQETFLSAWQRLGSMHEPESLLPWLRQVARNRAIDVVRRRRYTEVSVNSEDQRMASAVDTAATPVEQLEHAQQQALLMQVLDAIPDSSRDVLLLFYREGQSSRSVAALLGMSDAAVRKRLQRARDALQAEMLEMVGKVASASAPGLLFTTTVTSALAMAPGAASAAAAGSASKWLLGGLGSVFAAVGLVLAAVAWEVRGYVRKARSAAERRALLRHGYVYAALMGSFVLMLFWSKAAAWEFRTMLMIAACYSLAIILMAFLRVRIAARHRPRG